MGPENKIDDFTLPDERSIAKDYGGWFVREKRFVD